TIRKNLAIFCVKNPRNPLLINGFRFIWLTPRYAISKPYVNLSPQLLEEIGEIGILAIRDENLTV
ncbi:MAG: hypothetical protein ACK5QA_03555, partial [Dolichospermum sp.]